MISQSEATKSLTSALKGFGLEASNALSIVDKLTSVDSAAAVSAGEIATALSKSAVSARLAGLSMDELIASVSVIGEVTQNSMDSVGTAMKSLLARYGNVKAGVFSSMGLDDDGETTENINDIEKVLNKLGIRIRSSSLEMRSLSDVLDELNEQWSTYDTVTKNAVATAFGGTRQRENFLVLMENYDRYKELTEESANSAGTADKKYESYMDSMEAATKRLTNAWEEFSLKLQSSWIMKMGTNVLAAFVENLDRIYYLARSIIPILASKKITEFFGNTVQRGKELFGKFAGAKKIDFTKDENGNLVANLGGNQGVVRSGFSQLHQDLLKLIGVVNGDVTKPYESNIAGVKLGFRGVKQITTKDGTEIDFKKAYRGGNRSKEFMGGIGKARRPADFSRAINELDEYNKFKDSGGSLEAIEAIKRANTQLWKQSIGPAAIVGIAARLASATTKSYAGGSTVGASLAKALGIDSGDQQVESEGASIAKGVATGLGAGVSMLPPPWNLIGVAISTLAPIVIDFVATWINKDELERKERSEQAQKQLDALNNIEGKITENQELMSKDTWVSDDYESFKDYVDELGSDYLDMEEDFTGATQTFINNFNQAAKSLEITSKKIDNINDLYDKFVDESAETREKAQRAIEYANIKAQKEQYVQSQEDNLYNLNEEANGRETNVFDTVKAGNFKNNFLSSLKASFGFDVNGDWSFGTMFNNNVLGIGTNTAKSFAAIDLLTDVKGKSIEKLKTLLTKVEKDEKTYYGLDKDLVIETIEEQISTIEKAQKEIEEYNKELAEMNTQIGMLAADIWDFTDEELSALTMDGVMGKVVEAMKFEGVEVRDAAGYIKDEYVTAVKSAIKANSEFTSLLKGDTRTMTQIKEAYQKFKTVFEGKSYKELKDILDRGGVLHSYTSSKLSEDELAKIVYGADPTQLQTFANAWNMTIKQAENLTERFKELSTAEGLLSTSEIAEKYSNLSDIFEDLADNSGITSENFNKMIESYPQLISKTSNLTDLYDKIVNQQALSLANAEWTSLLTSESVGKDFKKSFEKNILAESDLTNIKDDLAKILGDEGFTITGLLELAQQYDKDSTEYKKIQEYISKYFSNIPDLEIENSLLEKAIEYQEKLWDIQKENLKAQKEALSEVNDEREKELELIKAQEQLENAKKEKKMVYREGVGFVYEADQSAISEAQKNLEDLDTEKRQEEIQTEIDRIDYLQETLDSLKNDQELAELKISFDTVAENLKNAGNEVSDSTQAIMSLVEALNNSKVSFAYDAQSGAMIITLPNGETQTFGTAEGINESTSNELQTLVDARKALDNSDISFNSNTGTVNYNDKLYDKGTKGYSKAVSEYNKLVENYTDAKEALGDKAKNNAEYKNAVSNDEGFTQQEDAKYKLYGDYISAPTIVGWAKGWKFGQSWKHDGLVLDTTNASIQSEFEKMGYTVYKKYDSENDTWGKWEALTKEETWKNLPNYSIVANEEGKDAYGFVYDGDIKRLSDKNFDDASYYSGTLSKPTSGLSYINELGTEAIITPSGTVTALPSKTGIVPADITKNLWSLGEVAPNLIGTLGSLKQQKFDTEARSITNEEGVYIDNLDMSIYPKEGYNMDEFISQLRAKAALTRQNN